MIKKRINEEYPHHCIVLHKQDIHIVDYSEKTKKDAVRRSVEIFESKPCDIDCFSLLNPPGLEIGSVVYDKYSFVDGNGEAQKQCECVVFPYVSDGNTWVLFLELKYCQFDRAIRNLNKAKKQLFATCKYFVDKKIVSDKQTKYLIVSLPQQDNVPFESFIVTQDELSKWKKEEGIIFRGINEARIKDCTMVAM